MWSLRVEKSTIYYGKFFIGINGRLENDFIAEYLNISEQEYQEILAQHNAIGFFNIDEKLYYFNNKKDAKNTLKQLESYIIFNKLVE